MRASRTLAALVAVSVLLALALHFGFEGGGESEAGGLEQALVGEASAPVNSTQLPEAPAPVELVGTEQEALEEPTRSVVASDSPERPASRPAEPFPLLPDPVIELEVAGDIAGRLVSEKGYWLPGELPETDTLIVELVRLEEPRLELRADLVTEELEEGLALSFLFEAVPVGEYELSLFNLGSWHWEPKTMRVRAPASGLDFVRYDKEVRAPIVFEVFDARSGDPIEDFKAAHLEQTVSEQSGVFMHAGPIDGDSFPSTARFNWSVWSEGYRAGFGDERAFQEREGARVARVELMAGWSARIVVLGREPTLRPLSRAGVRVDGRFVGATDSNGALVVELDEPPKAIEVDYKGWVLENDPLDPRPGTTPQLRGHVLPLILRAPQ